MKVGHPFDFEFQQVENHRVSSGTLITVCVGYGVLKRKGSCQESRGATAYCVSQGKNQFTNSYLLQEVIDSLRPHMDMPEVEWQYISN